MKKAIIILVTFLLLGGERVVGQDLINQLLDALPGALQALVEEQERAQRTAEEQRRYRQQLKFQGKQLQLLEEQNKIQRDQLQYQKKRGSEQRWHYSSDPGTGGLFKYRFLEEESILEIASVGDGYDRNQISRFRFNRIYNELESLETGERFRYNPNTNNWDAVRLHSDRRTEEKLIGDSQDFTDMIKNSAGIDAPYSVFSPRKTSNGKVLSDNPSGIWSGVLFQPQGNIDQNYSFNLALVLISEDELTGYSLITNSVGDYGFMKIEGKIVDGQITVIETGIIKQVNPRNGSWCMKGLTFNYTKPVDTIIGEWSGLGRCPGGTLAIKRVEEPI